MQFFTRIKLAVLTSLFAAGAASAVPVAGTIQITANNDPGFSYDAVAKTVTFGANNNARVSFASGSYFGLFDADVHYNSFTYDPLSIINPLWKTTSGAPAAEFSLTGISFIGDNTPAAGLVLQGWGVIKVAGFDDTPGNWSFAATRLQNGTQVAFNWSSLNTQPVPDGGASVALLGASLLGLAGARRFLKK